MITPLKEKHVRKTYQSLCKDHVILSAAHNIPENMKVELLGNKEEFLRGVVAGLSKSLVLLGKISTLLAQGEVTEALQLKAGVGATILLVCQHLLEEDELPDLPRIEVPDVKKIITP